MFPTISFEQLKCSPCDYENISTVKLLRLVNKCSKQPHIRPPCHRARIIQSYSPGGASVHSLLVMLSRAQASLSPNGISSGSAIFAALTVRLATHRLDHVTYIIGGNRPRLRYMYAMRPKTALHYSSRYMNLHCRANVPKCRRQPTLLPLQTLQ